jgi:hypothetical protein
MRVKPRIRKIMLTISGLGRHILATFFALILVTPICAFAQGTKKLADTFDQRYPAEQAPTRSSSEQVPTQRPTEQAPMQPPTGRDAQKSHRPEAQQNHPPEAAQRKKGANATTPTRVVSAKHSPARVVIVPRSFLNAGTEMQPGERKFLDYAFPRTHTAMDMVTNTGGHVGWHDSPLPGPLFPGHGPW